MQVTSVEDGYVVHRWVGDYVLLYRNGKVRGRFNNFDEMWAAWERLKLAFIHWRCEKTQATFFQWRDSVRCPRSKRLNTR